MEEKSIKDCEIDQAQQNLLKVMDFMRTKNKETREFDESIQILEDVRQHIYRITQRMYQNEIIQALECTSMKLYPPATTQISLPNSSSTATPVLLPPSKNKEASNHEDD